ncbi:hypothetical protein, partial [Deinococcus marmoris]|uniref:hypothetical protein n=1 Tax=Deinococcus marmoris TaxID=249408 RepID=UPI001B80720C
MSQYGKTLPKEDLPSLTLFFCFRFPNTAGSPLKPASAGHFVCHLLFNPVKRVADGHFTGDDQRDGVCINVWNVVVNAIEPPVQEELHELRIRIEPFLNCKIDKPRRNRAEKNEQQAQCWIGNYLIGNLTGQIESEAKRHKIRKIKVTTQREKFGMRMSPRKTLTRPCQTFMPCLRS